MRISSAVSRLSMYCRNRLIACAPKRYRYPNSDFGFYVSLSADPPIFHVKHWMDEELRFETSLEMLFEYLRDRTAYFLYNWRWYIEDPNKVKIVRQFEKQHRRKYRRHNFIHLCNTVRQQEIFEEFDLGAIFCNQNCLVDERIFKPLDLACKKYDAVYDARLKSYKRHDLASQVRSLALIYDFNPVVDDIAHVKDLKRQFNSAHFFNHPNCQEYRKLNPSELNRCLNQCNVGLCLSKVEGSMYASIQYLLSGLPIVSTESKGGRDVFFDDDFVIIVEDKPEAVAEGVQELLRQDISPEKIRRKTLKEMEVHRATLISVVQDIYDRGGVQRDFAAEWDNIYFNKLFKYQKHLDTIEFIETRKQLEA